MGWSLNEFGLDDSIDRPKLIVSSKSLDEEEIVDIVNKYRKSALSNLVSKDVSNTNDHVTPNKVVDVINDFRKEEKSRELLVTEEDMNLYDQVNRNCSSRLSEIKKEEISEEKIGQKRSSKEEISRVISSSESDRESESENIATEVACKKSGQVEKGKKGVRSKKKKNKKNW
ncbi:hypothetical protein RhiirA4_421777 [Rhizophagus irregularis]|uniref:Uncharacterized protein n=1 Tax=Rhizophagus irregularis TaxID=588596 RepID=A0A2I1GMR2_9GLOM|nr:hypothetical protein RhiirA4_421777 [Rhizophagus irregularis]